MILVVESLPVAFGPDGDGAGIDGTEVVVL